MSKICEAALPPPNDTALMCAWCWSWWEASDSEAGEWDGQAWSCPECIRYGENDPKWLGKMLGFIEPTPEDLEKYALREQDEAYDANGRGAV